MAPDSLVLHGGGGPLTVAPLVLHLSSSYAVWAPTHPGWEGSPLPAGTTIADLADLYLARVAERRDVVVVGSSIGGWIALEMALRDTTGTVGSLVLVDSVGVDVPGAPITPFVPDLDAFPAERRVAMMANGASLAALAGSPYMHDPGLLDRLRDVGVPTLVLWGSDDGVVSPAYGAALAAAIPGAQFAVVDGAGHLPHLEAQAATTALIDEFLATVRPG